MHIEHIEDILLALVLVALGASFAFKSLQAVFYGKAYYWAGWLPIGIVSPLFIHFPPGKNSLIKTVRGGWVHLLLGPAFFLLSLVLLAAGLDRMGFNGSGMVNQLLTLGNSDRPPAITYSRQKGYQFPIVDRAGKTLWKQFSKPADLKERGFLQDWFGLK